MIEERIRELQIKLPKPMNTSQLPFKLARMDGNLLYLSGLVPTQVVGSISNVRGKVGETVSLEQAEQCASEIALGMLASIKAELGDLDRVTGWLRVFGMVNAAEGFDNLPAVINGFSNQLLSIFGPNIGSHSRSAIGVSELPFSVPVEIEATVRVQI